MSIRNRLLLLGLATVLIPVCLTLYMIHSSMDLFFNTMQDAADIEIPEYLLALQEGDISFDLSTFTDHLRAIEGASDEAALIDELNHLDALMLKANIITEMSVEGHVYFESALIGQGAAQTHSNTRMAIINDIVLSDGRSARVTFHMQNDIISFAQQYFRNNSALITLILLISLALTCGVLSYLVSLSITRPVKSLTDGLREVRDGRLDGEPLKVYGHDEISQLAVGFNAMRTRLRASVSNQNQMENNRKELLVNIAHDLRTPITSIKGYVEGILDGVASDPARQEKYLHTILNKADEMNHLVDNLFLFSTLDMGRVQFDFEQVELGSFLADCAQELSYELSKQDMTITYSDHSPEPPIVLMDRMQFKRVILNIAENSDKYKRGDMGKLDISLSCQGDIAVIAFADDGVGIPADMLENVFGQFIRGDASRNATIKGNGLGLAIAREIIGAHDGEITASSPPGGGTVITIRLPMEGIQ